MSTIKPFPTRLNEKVRSHLESSNKISKRSLNSEIAYRIDLSIKLEALFNCSVDEVEYKISELKSAEKYKKMYIEANDKLKKHEASVNSVLAFANMNSDKAIKMKIDRAISAITSGLDDLKNVLVKSD